MKANIRLRVYEKAGSTKLLGELNLMAEQLSCRQECRLPALQGGEAQGPAGSPQWGWDLPPCPWQARSQLCWWFSACVGLGLVSSLGMSFSSSKRLHASRVGLAP